MNARTDILNVHERRFRAMGSDAHVIITGGTAATLSHALHRIDALEAHWSRFRDDSDISDLNRHAGNFRLVAADTGLMVERAIELWRLTGCAVDPLVLRAVQNAGYDRTFADVVDGPRPSIRKPWRLVACTDIEIERVGDECFVRLPSGSGFDPGGIGKGLAADLIVADVMAAGASGACVNLGGDLRVAGLAPGGSSWIVAVEHPLHDEALFTLDIVEGSVATSSTLRRSWTTVRGERMHHLIDPATGQPSTTDLVQATVVAANAWVAEGLAKALLLRGGGRAFDLLPHGIEAATIDHEGVLRTTDGLHNFVGAQAIPQSISLRGGRS